MFLSIASFLVALSKESSLHPPSKFLLRSLAATDLCVGIINQPLYVTHRFSVVYKRWDICHSTTATLIITGRMLRMVSLLSLAAISVDTLLALLLGLRYRQVKRTYVTVFTFWVSSFVGAIIFLYRRIFLRLRHHQTQVQDNITGQPNQTTPLNIERYRKTASRALWLQLALVVCYLPFIVAAPLAFREIPRGLFLAFFSCTGIYRVYFNSSLNPILYCWKIREVRQVVKEIVRQLFVDEVNKCEMCLLYAA